MWVKITKYTENHELLLTHESIYNYIQLHMYIGMSVVAQLGSDPSKVDIDTFNHLKDAFLFKVANDHFGSTAWFVSSRLWQWELSDGSFFQQWRQAPLWA